MTIKGEREAERGSVRRNRRGGVQRLTAQVVVGQEDPASPLPATEM